MQFTDVTNADITDAGQVAHGISSLTLSDEMKMEKMSNIYWDALQVLLEALYIKKFYAIDYARFSKPIYSPKKLLTHLPDVYPRFFSFFMCPLIRFEEKLSPPKNSYGSYSQGLD